MPSTTSSCVSSVFDSSTVMTPSLPTFFIASAMILPMVSSLFAEIVPTCAIISPVTGLESRSSSPLPRSPVLGSAVPQTRATAFSMPRFMAIEFAHHLRAHVLEAISEFDFFSYGNAVLGDGRRTEFLFNHNIAALGAQGYLHSISQEVDAAENCLTRLFSVYDLLCHRCLLLKSF